MESKITIIGKTNNKLLGLSQITSVTHTYGTALTFYKGRIPIHHEKDHPIIFFHSSNLGISS